MAAPQKSNSSDIIIPGMLLNMSMKIGRCSVELAKPCFTSGTSRVSRSRAARALGLRNKRKAVSPQSPPSPNQESAVNTRTGKVAFGPWLGPYETHSDTAAIGPLFLDHDGNTYASLNVPGLPDNLHGVSMPQLQTQTQQLPTEKQQPEYAKARTAATTQQLYAIVGKVAQCHAAATAHTRTPSQWPGSGKPHGNGRCGSTMARSINQPRRS